MLTFLPHIFYLLFILRFQDIYICSWWTCTVILQWLVWRKSFDWRIWASLIPIVGGILLTSVTELSFNMFGFCAALFGCLATSTKTILAESLLHGYKFDRCPLYACISFIVINFVFWCSFFSFSIFFIFLDFPVCRLHFSVISMSVMLLFLWKMGFYLIHCDFLLTFSLM